MKLSDRAAYRDGSDASPGPDERFGLARQDPAAPAVPVRRPERLDEQDQRDPPGPEPLPAPPPPVADPRRAPARYVTRTALLLLVAITVSLGLQVSVVSGLQHQATQARAFAILRSDLATGTAPVAQTDSSGRLLPLGTPVALLKVPSLHIREVVGEGTTPGVLMSGPGHRRDTPMPGQAGTSIILGRAAAYGGPFKRLSRAKEGTTITLSTGQGVSTYRVIGVRRAGDAQPPPLGRAKGRLQLVTATGTPFVPSGVLRVDAELTSETLATPPIRASTLPQAERPLGTDQSTAWALVLWLQALLLVAVAAVWSWSRWGRHQTWVVFVPLASLAGLGTAGQLLNLLPNLL